jgi:hypothetical protein
MVFGRNAVTTIPERSFAGFAAAPLAMTLVVCGGLLLLLPTTATANGAPAFAVVSALDCAASADRAGDQQFTADAAGLDAPDSCDDDDDDDVPSGSDAAITVDECRTRLGDDVLRLLDIRIDAWISRTVEGHSLRGPPPDDQRSSDADDEDVDGDDDDPSAECFDLLPPAPHCAACFLTPAEFLSASSTRSSVLSLRAPPLSRC